MAFALGGTRFDRREYRDVDTPQLPHYLRLTAPKRLLWQIAHSLQALSNEVRNNPTQQNLRRLRYAYTRLRDDLRLLGYGVSSLSLILRQLPASIRYYLTMGLYHESPIYDDDPGPRQWNINRAGFGKIEYRQYDPKQRMESWKPGQGSRAESKKKRREANNKKYGVGNWRYA